MSGETKISWATDVWNPVVGCTRVSEGCRHCYAFDVHDARHKAYQDGKLQHIPQYAKPFREVQLLPERLAHPLRWTRPRRVFVNSMSDLFHPDVPDHYIDRVWGVMIVAANRGDAGQHTFQVLTKRPERMRDYLLDPERPRKVANATAPHVQDGDLWHDYLTLTPGALTSPRLWLGTSVEDQKTANARVPVLLQTPAAVRFLSAEPLLGPVDLRPWTRFDFCPEENDPEIPEGEWACQGCDGSGARPGSECRARLHIGLHLVIVGGESGEHARPMHPAWARELRDQCGAANVAFHFKQWGAWAPLDTVPAERRADLQAFTFAEPHEGVVMLRAPRGRAWPDRALDGRTHDDLPGADA